MEMTSEDLLLRRSVGELELAPSRLSRSQITEIMSYKDLIEALEESQRECASLCIPNKQNAASNVNNDSSVPSPSSSAEDTDSGSSSSQFDGISEPHETSAELPPTSVSSDSDSKERRRATRNSGIHIPLSLLVEFGIHTPALELTTRTRSGTFGSLDQTTFQGIFPPSRTAVQMRSRSLGAHVEQPTESFVELLRGGNEDSGSDLGSYNSDDESEKSPYLVYTKTQVTLFGDFLHSPFANAASEPSHTIGTCPFSTEAHTPCECDTCFLADVALTREFSEPHPIASWHAKSDYDSDYDSGSE